MRVLGIYVLVLFCFKVFAQNVPNGGFENWETEDFFVVDDWVSYGKPLRTIDASSGSYALKLQNYANSQGNFTGSSIYNVDWRGGGVDKFPYDGDPLSMVFDAKYNLAAGDSATFTSGFYEKGVWIGDATIRVTGNSSGEFLTYSVPIRWYTTSRTPDSVYIGMSSLSQSGFATGEGYIIVDDFRFENIGNRTVEINNYDFEEWTNSGVKYPTGWMPIDLLSFKEWGGFLLNPSVVRSTQAFKGQHCLAIQNFDSWNETVGEGYCFTGDTSRDAWRPAFPINEKYQYLQGYFKLENGGNDSAEIALNVFLSGNYLGEGSIKLGGNTPDWTFFSIPVSYFVDLVPDSATVRITSSINQDNNSSNTTLYLDDIQFVNTIDNKVSATTPDLDSFGVFPNPFEHTLSITSRGGTYTITNSLGSIVQREPLQSGRTQIDLKHIPSGMYTLILTNKNNQQWQKKVIKR